MTRATIRHRSGLLLTVPVAAVILAACAPGPDRGRVPGFYAEIAVEAGTPSSDPLARFGSGSRLSVIRWWYAPDPARWRWEVETVGTAIDDGVVTTVFDGDDAWEYDDRSRTYRRVLGRYARLGAEALLVPTFSAPVGPARAGTVEALVAQWRGRGDEPAVTLAGEATLLGRRTQIVELRPPAGGVARAFVDPERMFVMRWDVDGAGGGQSYGAEVTALDYGADVDAARLTFEPPPGAREAGAETGGSCSAVSGPIGGGSFPAEPGFLAPAYVPEAYSPVGTGRESGASSCDPIAVWALLEAADGRSILLRQRVRAGGMPPLEGSWQAIDSGVDDARYRRSADGVLSLIWRAGDIVALIQADAAVLDELVRIAESADLVPARSR